MEKSTLDVIWEELRSQLQDWILGF